MAWNDIYQDDNAVHLMITIGGHKYNFGSYNYKGRNIKNGAVGTDIKVERRIGDTLSKFSLGIVDDGSDDYIEFERVVLNRFVNIEITYGNSSKTLCTYKGFVVDYQPVFFGSSTKLTITGYLTRQKKGVPDQSNAYIYYIDWCPVVGKRRNVTKNSKNLSGQSMVDDTINTDWDDIYNGNFSFQADMWGNQLEDAPLVDAETAQAKVSEAVEERKNRYINSTKYSLANKVKGYFSNKANRDKLNDYFPYYSHDENWVVSQTNLVTAFAYPESSGFILVFEGWEEEGWESLQQIEESGGGNEFSSQVNYFYVNPDENDFDSTKWKNVLGEAFYNQFKTTYDTIQKYDNAAEKLMYIAENDTIQDYANETYFEVGHVPWNYDAIKNYTGNIMFSKYTHPYNTKRSIARVIPDLFIEWDRDIPVSPEYMDKEGKPMSGNYGIFPDWAINDIKVFGLQYEFNEDIYKQNPGDPYRAFALQEDDLHGVRRIYRTKDKDYIWVGDAPELYKKWKESNWNYQSTKNETTQEEILDSWVEYDEDSEKPYKTGTYLRKPNSKGVDNCGRAQKDFTPSGWTTDVNNGNIKTARQYGYTDGNLREFKIWGEALKYYKITSIPVENPPLKGMKPIAASDRITQYLQAAYRSAQVIAYGFIYISDIVAQLCVLEGWDNPEIASTTASSYKSDFLKMEGRSALQYIAESLCPNATESGGSGRTGFQCFFDSAGRFHFIPIDITKSSTVLTIGYNIQNSSVLSFTVRSRGQLLMLGIDESLDSTNALTGEPMSTSTNKSASVMSETETKLNEAAANHTPTFSFLTDSDEKTNMLNKYNALTSDDARFFNMSLFNYYGYEPTVDGYLYFTTKLYDTGGIDETMSYGTSLLRRTYKSSSSSSTAAVLSALADLDHLSKTCIQAELTMIGDNNIAPGDYIHVVNYTRRGKHYTSGDYYVQQITDSVTAANGFTQSLKLWRYSNNVRAMNTKVTFKTISNSISSKFDTALSIYLDQGQAAFDSWYEKNAPSDKHPVEEKMLTHTFDCNGGSASVDGKSVSSFEVKVKPGDFIPEPDCEIWRYSKNNGVNLPATNYEFEYWYLASEGEDVKFDFNRYIVACDATFKAKWKESLGTATTI